MLDKLILLLILGLDVLAGGRAEAVAAATAESPASGSASTPEYLIGIETQLGGEGVRGIPAIADDFASDDAVAATEVGPQAGRGLDDILKNEKLFERWLHHKHPADKPLSAEDARNVWDKLRSLERNPRLDPGHPSTKWDTPHVNVDGTRIPVDPSFVL